MGSLRGLLTEVESTSEEEARRLLETGSTPDRAG